MKEPEKYPYAIKIIPDETKEDGYTVELVNPSGIVYINQKYGTIDIPCENPDSFPYEWFTGKRHKDYERVNLEWLYYDWEFSLYCEDSVTVKRLIDKGFKPNAEAEFISDTFQQYSVIIPWRFRSGFYPNGEENRSCFMYHDVEYIPLVENGKLSLDEDGEPAIKRYMFF